MSRLISWKALAIGVVALAAVATAVLLSTSGSEPSDAASATGPDPSLSVLAPPAANAQESIPAAARPWLEQMEGSSLPEIEGEGLSGLGVATTKSGGEVVIAQLGQNVCAYSVEAAVSGCATIESIKAGQMVVVKPACGKPYVMGVVPDGFDRLSVLHPGSAQGAADELQVTANVFAAELAPEATVLTGTADSGETLAIQVPLDQTPTAC